MDIKNNFIQFIVVAVEMIVWNFITSLIGPRIVSRNEASLAESSESTLLPPISEALPCPNCGALYHPHSNPVSSGI